MNDLATNTGALSAEDEHRIASVTVRYATGIDRRDWALFRTCFTDDLQADYGEFGVWSSAEAITRAMEEMHLPFGPTLHRMSNTAPLAVPGGATARTYVDVILTPKETGGVITQAAGYYDDELVKSAAGWRIKKRRFTLVRFQQTER
jgi:hypothetical protein